MEERAGNPVPPEEFDRAFDGISFSDSAKVEHNSWFRKTDGKLRFVQLNQVHAHHLACRIELSGVGEVAGPIPKAPTMNQRSDGQVECAVSCFAEGNGFLQKREKARGDPDWFYGSTGIEMGNFTGRTKEAELGFKAINFVECFFTRSAQTGGILTTQQQLEPGRHCVASEADDAGGGLIDEGLNG
jgi:hypothetical protein